MGRTRLWRYHSTWVNIIWYDWMLGLGTNLLLKPAVMSTIWTTNVIREIVLAEGPVETPSLFLLWYFHRHKKIAYESNKTKNETIQTIWSVILRRHKLEMPSFDVRASHHLGHANHQLHEPTDLHCAAIGLVWFTWLIRFESCTVLADDLESLLYWWFLLICDGCDGLWNTEHFFPSHWE